MRISARPTLAETKKADPKYRTAVGSPVYLGKQIYFAFAISRSSNSAKVSPTTIGALAAHVIEIVFDPRMRRDDTFTVTFVALTFAGAILVIARNTKGACWHIES